MSKQLLTEYFELCPEGRCPIDRLTEVERRNISDGAVYLVGVCQKAGTKNGNGRIYRKETLQREVENYQRSIVERRSLGELDHPDDSVVNLKNCSHLAVKMWWEGDNVMAKFEVLDTGKPIQEADCVDIETGADVIEYYAGLAPTQLGTQQPVGGDFFYTRKEALGVCAGIGAWNYPIQITCWKSGPALAAGNAFIFKPSEETPLVGQAYADILNEFLPEGVLQIIHGADDQGKTLVESDINLVAFTGSREVGAKILTACGPELKRVVLELGGKTQNP